MMKTRIVGSAGLAAVLGLVACSGGPAKSPTPFTGSFPDAFVSAVEKEQDQATAAEGYLDLVDAAVSTPESPYALPAAIASLDALVFGATSGLGVPGRSGIAYRSREGFSNVAARLRAAWDHGAQEDGARVARSSRVAPIRGWIASALDDLALYSGDEPAAKEWGAKRGCATEATVIGPTQWTALRGLEGRPPVAADAPLEASYDGVAPFAAHISPVIVKADSCALDLNAASFLQGTRVVVVDLDVPKTERVFVAITAASAAVVDVGGARVVKRGIEDGGRNVVKLGAADVEAGRVRVVVRVAERGDSNQIELDAWGEDGTPLVAHAPRPGDAARAKALSPEAISVVPASEVFTPNEAALFAAALLGAGDARGAEHLLEEGVAPSGVVDDFLDRGGASPRPARATPTPATSLMYARALDQVDDMPDDKVVELLRAAVANVQKEWPRSWEARIDHARATERRRGQGDGTMDALAELGVAPDPNTGATTLASSAGAEAKGKSAEAEKPRDRMILGAIAATAKRAGMTDAAEQAYRALESIAPGSPLIAAVDRLLHVRLGKDYERVACEGGSSRVDADCLSAKRDLGDYAGALAELARLRRLRGEGALDEAEMSILVHEGDVDGALKLYDSLPPGQRRLNDTLGLAIGRGKRGAAEERLARDRTTGRDAPYAIATLATALGLEPDLTSKLEKEGRAIVEQDRAHAFLPGAATAVLRHVERYRIEASGLVHYVNYDLRRVSGTTDVAYGAQSYGANIEGRGAPRLLRKRIHKKDGRVLEPDASPMAQQGGSDLSQLEAGDYVEQLVEGWFLPGDSGQVVIDTPDLMPERTSVREAEIELARAPSIPLTIWSHALLGKPEEKTEGGMKVSVWRLHDAAPRRMEEGVPAGERGVGISVGTQTWAQIARAFQDDVASYEDHDPFVARWADSIAGADKTPNRALIEKVVAATGKKVKIAGIGEFSDVAAMFGGGPQKTTLRSIVESRQGSRSWVVYRTLKQLGFKVDLAIAETEPFSSSENYPAHAGRFRHALVVAHLDKGEDVWIDADIEGPPLPPGRLSPELRGRQALLTTGDVVTIKAPSGENGDEIDVRLALDEKGDAKGTFTILLHGRTAQSLADAFETVVGTERRQLLRSVVLGWVPWADVDEVQVSSNEGSWEVALRAGISIHGFGRPEGRDGKTWVLPGVEPVHDPVGSIAARYAARGKRQSALVIDAPLQYHVHRRIELPRGATLASLAANADVKDEHVDASRTARFENGVIEEEFKLNLPTGTVKAEADYNKFVGALHAIDDDFMAGVRVKK